MTNKVYAISGSKIASLCLGENAILISSQNFNSIDDFMEGWNKKLSLATKVEIKYESIKSVKKEDSDDDILIKYKTLLGLPSDCEFSFSDSNDYDTFFTFLEKEKYFSKMHETLTPFKAILNYLLGLVFVISVTVFSYFEALKIANGTVEEEHGSKTILFNNFVEFLGDKGVLALGTLIVCYLLYKIWTRFSNPPNQLKLLPPNS
jgi:hypothetical protein